MPRIADSDFISAFNFAASTPYGDTSQSMWRVIDCSDIVTTVPTGLADIEENRTMLPRTSLLNCRFIPYIMFPLSDVKQYSAD